MFQPIAGPQRSKTDSAERTPFAANFRERHTSEKQPSVEKTPAFVNARNPIAGHPSTWPKIWPGDAVPKLKENKLGEKEKAEFLAELNKYRAAHHLKPVKLSEKLSNAADQHSLYQTSLNSCNHYGPQGKLNWYTGRAKEAGYSGQPVSENVAAGQNSVKEALWAWHTSLGHRRALLNPSITEIGIGFRRGTKGPYGGERWTFMSGKDEKDSNNDGNDRLV